MKKAIVTLAIGKSYEAMFEQYCKPLWSLYAEKHGLDFILITQHLDNSPRAQSRTPAWQKCLIFSDPRVQKYEQVVWIDTDILINPNSPDVTMDVPLEKIGVVDEAATPSQDDLKLYLERFHEHFYPGGKKISIENIDAPNQSMQEYLKYSFNPSAYYNDFGLEGKFESIVQTGVMVLSQKYHRELLEHVYYGYEDKGPEWNYEQRPLGYEILKQKQEFWMSTKFNMTWVILKALFYPFLDSRATLKERVFRKFGVDPRASLISQCMTATFLNNYFLHYAGGKGSDMRYVDVSQMLIRNSLNP
jgi:hypothetical protein